MNEIGINDREMLTLSTVMFIHGIMGRSKMNV